MGAELGPGPVNPSTCILVLSKDTNYLIRYCLEGLLATVDPRECEILIGDTGSTSTELVQLYDTFGARYGGRFEVVALGKYHLPANYNQLVTHTDAHHLLFLSADTHALPNWLDPLRTYAGDPRYGVAGATLLLPSTRRVVHTGVEFVRGPGLLRTYHPHAGRRPNMPDISFDRIVPAVSGACLTVLRRSFFEVGGFDESYRNEFMDVDLCLKLHQRLDARPVCVANSVLFGFEKQARRGSKNTRDLRRLTRNWSKYVERTVFSQEPQSTPVDPLRARERQHATRVLIRRIGARGDVFASTAVVEQYKKENPNHHITFKTSFPALVDGVPFIDRVLNDNAYDEFDYDIVLDVAYEGRSWKTRPTTWIHEMGVRLGLRTIPKDLRPRFQFTRWDDTYRREYKRLSQEKPYVVFAAGAGDGSDGRRWADEGWAALAQRVKQSGFEVLQIGGPDALSIPGTRQVLGRDLHQSLAILEPAHALVTEDTFAYHLGLAASIPVYILTCATSSHTLWMPGNVTEVRNRDATEVPFVGCRSVGCRCKFGSIGTRPCVDTLLQSLPSDVVFEHLRLKRHA